MVHKDTDHKISVRIFKLGIRFFHLLKRKVTSGSPVEASDLKHDSVIAITTRVPRREI